MMESFLLKATLQGLLSGMNVFLPSKDRGPEGIPTSLQSKAFLGCKLSSVYL